MPSGKTLISEQPPHWMRMQPVWCFALAILQSIAIVWQVALISMAFDQASPVVLAWWCAGVGIGLLVMVSILGHGGRYLKVRKHWEDWRRGALLSSTLRARIYRDWLYVDTQYRYGRWMLAGWMILAVWVLAQQRDVQLYLLVAAQCTGAALVWACRRSMQSGFAWANRCS